MQFARRGALSAGLCEHVGAAFSLILEEKMALGLAALPPERLPQESLEEDERGQVKLTVTLPDGKALEALAQALARLLGSAGQAAPYRDAHFMG